MSIGDDPAVDVVIPVRNGARFLKACLDSVMAQTRAPRAVIVVDDGSSDATPQLLSEYAARWPELEVIRSEPLGVSHARNLAIRACTAPYIGFLDSDDIWAPEKLERQMAMFSAAGPDLGLVYCAYRSMDVNGTVLAGHHVVEPKLRGKVFRDLLLQGNRISGSCSAVIARRSLIERVGGFDERLFRGEDWDLWLRLAEISDIDFTAEPLVDIRVHGKSMQRGEDLKNSELFLHQMLLIMDRWYERPQFPSQLRHDYRRTVGHLAILKAKRRPPLLWLRQLKLFWKVKFGSSRFGHDLFSGPIDFLAAMYRARLISLWHRLQKYQETE